MKSETALSIGVFAFQGGAVVALLAQQLWTDHVERSALRSSCTCNRPLKRTLDVCNRCLMLGAIARNEVETFVRFREEGPVPGHAGLGKYRICQREFVSGMALWAFVPSAFRLWGFGRLGRAWRSLVARIIGRRCLFCSSYVGHDFEYLSRDGRRAYLPTCGFRVGQVRTVVVASVHCPRLGEECERCPRFEALRKAAVTKWPDSWDPLGAVLPCPPLVAPHEPDFHDGDGEGAEVGHGEADSGFCPLFGNAKAHSVPAQFGDGVDYSQGGADGAHDGAGDAQDKGGGLDRSHGGSPSSRAPLAASEE